MRYNVKLSHRQRFDLYTFLANTVQPKDRAEARTLKKVFETFSLNRFQDDVERAQAHKQPAIDRLSYPTLKEEIAIDELTMVSTLEYLDRPGATAIGSLLILEISEELLASKERPKVEVPKDESYSENVVRKFG